MRISECFKKGGYIRRLVSVRNFDFDSSIFLDRIDLYLMWNYVRFSVIIMNENQTWERCSFLFVTSLWNVFFPDVYFGGEYPHFLKVWDYPAPSDSSFCQWQWAVAFGTNPDLVCFSFCLFFCEIFLRIVIGIGVLTQIPTTFLNRCVLTVHSEFYRFNKSCKSV